jgi:hypothetical protein
MCLWRFLPKPGGAALSDEVPNDRTNGNHTSGHIQYLVQKVDMSCWLFDAHQLPRKVTRLYLDLTLIKRQPVSQRNKCAAAQQFACGIQQVSEATT